MNTKAKEILESHTGKFTLGKLLWSIRVSEDWTQDEMAVRLQITKSHLCDIEKGRKAISPERAELFAKKLKYPPKQFVRLALQDLLNQAGLKYSITVAAA